MKKLHIFTLVFGGKYISYWKRASAVSLLWPQNIAALDSVDVLWDIYTSRESEAEVAEVAEALPFQHHITLVEADKSSGLVQAIEKAYRAQAYFMHMPSDMIWGDGSVGSLLKLMLAYGRCLAVPHMRVAAGKFLQGFTGEPLTNAQLVKMAFDSPHDAFAGAMIPADRSNVSTTGHCWTKLRPNVYAVGFFIPTIHLMQPTEFDVKWFKTTKGRDHWDHRFPESLVGTDRHRIVGSSDAAFMVELTEDDAVHPRMSATIKGQWDQYNGTRAHHIANRNTISIFRAES